MRDLSELDFYSNKELNMERKPYPSDSADKFMLRLPAGMRDNITEVAKANGRSMNSEIVYHLRQAFPESHAVDQVTLQTMRERNDSAARASFIKAPGGGNSKRAIDAAPVTIRELAGRIGMDVSSCRRYVLRLGYKPTKHRTADSGYQMALTVTATEARTIQQQRATDGYCKPPD